MDADSRKQPDDESPRLQALLILTDIFSSEGIDGRESLRHALKLACEYLGLPFGIISHIRNEKYQIQVQVSPPDTLKDGDCFPLGETYCSLTLRADDVLAIGHMANSDHHGHPCYQAFQLESYIGIPLRVSGELYGTLNFSSPEPRASGDFSEADIEFVRLLGNWVNNCIHRWQLDDALHHREKELAASEMHLRELFEQASDGIFIADLEGRYTDVNSAGCRMLGYQREELLGKTILDLIPETEMDRLWQSKQKMLAGNSHVAEWTLRCKDGSFLPVEVSAKILPDGSWQGFVRDITERKRNERLKNEFVSTVSHELRTPLTSIVGALGLLNKQVLGTLSDQTRDMVNIAHQNSQRLAMLIDDLLDMEKLEAGKIQFNLQPQTLQPLIEQTIRDNQGYAQQHQVKYVFNPGDHPVQVRVDTQRLQQVLANLLSNATKFSPPGSQVDISLTTAGNRTRVTVTDQGPGIPESFRDTVFEKFAQADSSATRQKGGTGLGLAISRALIEQMQGTIGFDSRIGEGTSFYFELPLVEQ